MKKKRILIVLIVFVCLVLFGTGLLGYFENRKLVITEYSYANEKIPEEFSGFKIAQVSDFHNPRSEEPTKKLIKAIKDSKPDIIVITGDLIDSRNTRIDIALDFVSKITEVAPVYFVTGNHEGRITEYQRLRNGLESIGVIILEDECVQIERGGKSINILGLNDPAFHLIPNVGGARLLKMHIRDANVDRSKFTVVLAHHPEYRDAYDSQKMELVLCGHAHGGQIRFPAAGGLYSPGQGLFPEFDAGMYKLDYSTMIVSRGIGNSAFPFRLNNPPELVIVTLENE